MQRSLKIVAISIAISISLCNAQPNLFSKIYFGGGNSGSFYPFSILQMLDSTLIIGGYSISPSKSFVFQVNSKGDSINYYKTDSIGAMYSLVYENDSECVASSMFILNKKQINIVKYNYKTSDTSDYWVYYFPNFPQGYVTDVTKISQNGYILTNTWATTYSVLRVDSLGQIMWNAPSFAPGNLETVEDYDGNFVMLGCNNSTVLKPYYLQKIDTSGNILWSKWYGDNIGFWDGNCTGGLVQMKDSNYLVGCDGMDYELMKIDRYTGDTIWTRPYTYNNKPGIIKLMKGYNDTYVALRGPNLICFNENGDVLWETANVPPIGYNYNMYSLIKTFDQGYAMCGGYFKLGIWKNALVVFKTDSLGNTIFTSQIEIPNETELLVYPNPTSDILNFNLPTELDGNNVTITVYDGMGSEKLRMKSEKLNTANYQINCSHLPNGLYSISILTEGNRYWQKFVVQH
ncbi:MAG: T9SS type A sorting domain-containing protein [Bacteroidetes bacterium]|nr:T9SS type A sorting domain-containing protein [Bacteroidota bacterium]